MDSSETYIKMCEKAEEIQGQADDERDGDFWCGGRTFHPVPFLYTNCHDEFECYAKFSLVQSNQRKNRQIWLPRQDQLQEMVWKDFKLQLISHALMDFYNWAQSLFDELDDYESMEQLWLAFVMLQKYRKTWNGEDWIKTTLGG